MTDRKRGPSANDRDAGERERQEKALDEALMDTFPASDPVSIVQPKPRREPQADEAGKAAR